MKIINKIRSSGWFVAILVGCFVVPYLSASAGDFYPSYEAKVVGHIVLSGNPVRRMLLQQAGRREFIYVKQASQPGFTVIDVTKPKTPRVVSRISQRNLTILSPGLAIAETPARSDDNRTSAETVRVLNVSDPANPRTIKTFEGVTGIVRDDARKLIYVANRDGIWILSHQTVLRRHECSSSDAISSAIPNCN